MFRRYIARRASQRFDDEALRQALQQCELETDEHAMVQATIGLSYAALATPGEAEARTEVLRAQLHAIGPDYDDRRVAAFGGLLALGQIDVFVGAKEGRNDEPLEINLAGQFKNYAPVLELVAERWDELETATGGFPLSRLSQWTHDPARFWRAFVPYLSRSSRLRTRFLEYCEDESVVLEAPGLMALSRLRPGSSLLLDCCKRVLAAEFDAQKWTPFGAARTMVVASKCLAAHFSEDSSAVAAIIAASDSLRAQGAALVGLASHWPDHELVVREYRNLMERPRWSRLLVCAQLWLLSAQGTHQQVATALARFVTRPASSPWDFPEDALDAFRARLERDPEVEETLRQLAMDNDEPSIRASTVRLLASMSTWQSQDLAEELLAAECLRSGPPRFALDILTNRIRSARELMRDVLRDVQRLGRDSSRDTRCASDDDDGCLIPTPDRTRSLIPADSRRRSSPDAYRPCALRLASGSLPTPEVARFHSPAPPPRSLPRFTYPSALSGPSVPIAPDVISFRYFLHSSPPRLINASGSAGLGLQASGV